MLGILKEILAVYDDLISERLVETKIYPSKMRKGLGRHIRKDDAAKHFCRGRKIYRRGYAEHAFAVEAAVRDENMAVRVEAENIAEGLDGDDRAWNGILFVSDPLKKVFQRFPGAAAQVMQKFSIIEKVPAQDFREAEDEMAVWNFFQHIRA